MEETDKGKVIGTVFTEEEGREIEIHYGDRIHSETWNGFIYDGIITAVEDDCIDIDLDNGCQAGVNGGDIIINGKPVSIFVKEYIS